MPIYGFYSTRAGLGESKLPPEGVIRVMQAVLSGKPGTNYRSTLVEGDWVYGGPPADSGYFDKDATGRLLLKADMAFGYAEFESDEAMLAAMEKANAAIEPIGLPEDHDFRKARLADLEGLIDRLKKLAEKLRWEITGDKMRYYQSRKHTYRNVMGVEPSDPRALPKKLLKKD